MKDISGDSFTAVYANYYYDMQINLKVDIRIFENLLKVFSGGMFKLIMIACFYNKIESRQLGK